MVRLAEMPAVARDSISTLEMAAFENPGWTVPMPAKKSPGGNRLDGGYIPAWGETVFLACARLSDY